jgi:hypothetical protein
MPNFSQSLSVFIRSTSGVDGASGRVGGRCTIVFMNARGLGFVA